MTAEQQREATVGALRGKFAGAWVPDRVLYDYMRENLGYSRGYASSGRNDLKLLERQGRIERRENDDPGRRKGISGKAYDFRATP